MNSSSTFVPPSMSKPSMGYVLSFRQNVSGSAAATAPQALLIVDNFDADQMKKMLKSVLSGNNASLKELVMWIPKNQLIVFASSTFTDTHLERNILLEKIIPVVQAAARAKGIFLSAVDMRYGVKDENTVDHQTWIACAKQIEVTFEESAGLCFISFQSMKYGYRPVPKYVPQGIFDDYKRKNVSKPQLDALEQWYKLDTNNDPPRYVLKNLASSGDKKFWDHDLALLRDALDGIAFDPDSSPDIIVGKSVTDYELRFILSLISKKAKAQAARTGTPVCLWLRRNFHDNLSESETRALDKNWEYSDVTPNTKVAEHYQDLIKYMEDSSQHMRCIDTSSSSKITIAAYKEVLDEKIALAKIASASVSAPALSTVTSPTASAVALTNHYLSDWRSTTEGVLNAELETLSVRMGLWRNDGDGLGLPGADITEMIHH